MVTCGPMCALGSTLAPAATLADGSMPGAGGTASSAAKYCAARAKYTYGLAVTMRAPRYVSATPASSAGATINAAAPLCAACARSLLLLRKLMSLPVASANGAIPLTSRFGSPTSWPPKRSTNSPSRVPILVVRSLCSQAL